MVQPAEIGIRQEDKRPYGTAGVQAERMRRVRQQAERNTPPAEPVAPQPGPAPSPRPMGPAGPSAPGTMEWPKIDLNAPATIEETPILGGLISGLEYVTRSGRAAVGAAMEAADVDLPFGLGEKGPTEATQSDDFLPAAARAVADALLWYERAQTRHFAEGQRGEGGEAEGEPMPEPEMTFRDQAIETRAAELVAEGASDEDAVRLAGLEETYNVLGTAGAVSVGLLLGVPATFAAGVGTLYRLEHGEKAFADMERLAERRLEPGSFGGAAVEFGIPEVGAFAVAAKALQASRLRYAAATKAAFVADDPVRLRLDALAQYQEDLRVVSEAVERTEDVTPEAVILRAEATAERTRTASEAARLAGEPPVLIDEADEAAMMAGIQAAVDALPAAERASVSVGEAMVRAERQAKAAMFRALRSAAQKGETFRSQVVTVGADAENNAIRVRKMVGSFDQAVEDMKNALRRGGRTQEQITATLAPFLRARAVAAETLAAIEESNTALRGAVKVAQQERRVALQAVRKAREQQAKAEKQVEQTAKKEAKAGEKVEAQKQKETERAERTTSRLEQKIAQQRSRLQTEREIVAKVKGDKQPTVTDQQTLMGYPNADKVRFLQDQGVTGVAGMDPATVDAIYDWVKADPLRARVGYQHVSWRSITAETADLTGIDLEKIRKGLPETSQMTKAFYVLNQVFGAKLRQWHALGKAVKSGLATDQQLTDATVELMRFQSDLRRGIGEVARTLGQQRLLKKADAVELVKLQKVVKAKYADVERIAKRIDHLEGLITTEKAAKPLSERVVGLTAELDAATQEYAAALAALDDAKAAVNTAWERNLRAALDLAAKRGATPEKLKVLAEYEPEEIVKIANELRKLEPLGLGHFVQRGLIGGRFGKIYAQVLNFADTGLNAYYETGVLRPLAGAVSRIPRYGVQAIAGAEKPLFVKGETKAAWMAMWHSEPDAWRFFARTLWQGDAGDVALRNGVTDYETFVGAGLDTPGTHFRIDMPEREGLRVRMEPREFDITGPKWLPFDSTLRMLYASDGYWRVKLTNANVAARSLREVTVSGGNPDDYARAFVDADRRVREAAMEASRITTYNEPFARKGFDNALNSLLGAKNWGGLQPMRLLLPAARFGKRYVEMGYRFAGGGLFTGRAKAIAARGMAPSFERDTLMRRAALEQAAGAAGIIQFVTGVQLVAAGVITGPMPTSEADRLEWERLGKKPMSLRIPLPDGSYGYFPLGLFGAPAAGFAMAAITYGAAQDMEDAELEDLVGRAGWGLGQWFLDQPAAFALRQLGEAIWNATQYQSTRQLEAILANVTKPGAATQAAAESFTAVFDRYQRDPEGYLQMLLAKLPVASMTVPARIDPATGQPRERAVSGPAAIFQSEFEAIGVERPSDEMSDVERAITEVGAGVSSMSRTITSGQRSSDGFDPTVRLSGEEYERLSRRAGTLGHGIARALINSSEYQQGDVRTRQSIIQTAYERARSTARREFALSLFTSAKTPEDAERALLVTRASLEEDQYERAVQALYNAGLVNEEVIRHLDGTRPSFRSPTVQQIVGGQR